MGSLHSHLLLPSWTEHASPRTGRGEAAALQPWLSGSGSEASAGLGLYLLRRLLDSHGLQRPGFCGLGGTGVCSERRVPDGPALRGAHELGCVRSRERSARGRGGSRWPGTLLPQPEPPTSRAGSGLCAGAAALRSVAGGRGCLGGARRPRRGGVSPINTLGNARRRQRGRSMPPRDKRTEQDTIRQKLSYGGWTGQPKRRKKVPRAV